MKKCIPYNAITNDYEGLLNVYIKQICEGEHDNIMSVFLTGSFARGEATENSDLDLWCIFKAIDIDTLSKIGFISQNLPISYNQLEVNSQCLSIEEFNSGLFTKFIVYPIIYLEGILLFGEDVAIKPIQDEIVEKTYKEILADVLLGIRHYISVNEPTEKLTFQKIRTWVLNPLMFALRLERYLHTKKYPITCNDLLIAYDNSPMSIIYFMNKEKWDNDISNNRIGTLCILHDEVKNMLIHTR